MIINTISLLALTVQSAIQIQYTFSLSPHGLLAAGPVCALEKRASARTYKPGMQTKEVARTEPRNTTPANQSATGGVFQPITGHNAHL